MESVRAETSRNSVQIGVQNCPIFPERFHLSKLELWTKGVHDIRRCSNICFIVVVRTDASRHTKFVKVFFWWTDLISVVAFMKSLITLIVELVLGLCVLIL